MKRSSLPPFIVYLTLAATASHAQSTPTEVFQGHVAAANEILVKVAPRSATAATLSQVFDADRVEGIGSHGWVRIHSRSKNVAALMTQVAARADIIGFEPNYAATIGALQAKPVNDQYYGQLWGLPKIGADLAWNYTTGGARDTTSGQARGVVAGIVDTGIDTSHADLSANIWSAPASFNVCFGPNVGTDPSCTDPLDTMVQCPAGSLGFNAVATPMVCVPPGVNNDGNGHGTHVSGTIGAVGNNGIGVVGVNWIVPLMLLKSCNSTGQCLATDAVNAISFAVQAKNYFANTTTPVNVRVLNGSWGNQPYLQSLLNEIYGAGGNGMLFVTIAQNSAQNIDPPNSNYPASYNLDGITNLIAVYATADTTDTKADYSNYGSLTVDLGAPGGNGSRTNNIFNIYSTYPPGDASPPALPPQSGPYQYDVGTSQAAPHVSGTALLMLTRCSLTTLTLKNLIRNTVDVVDPSKLYSSTGGRLNTYKAIRACAALRPFPAETDANGDSYGDVLAYEPSTGNEYTHLSMGNGSYTTATNSLGISTVYDTLLRGDFNGDHMADVYAYSRTSGLSTLGYSNSSGTMTLASSSIQPGYDFVRTGDFNGDGKTDIVVYNSANGNAAIGIAGPNGFTFTTLLWSPGFTSMVVADFNGDGYADLALYNKNNAIGYMLTNTADGQYIFTSVSLFLGGNYDWVVSGDIDGDGKADLVIYNSANGTIWAGIFTGTSGGAANFTWTYTLVSTGYTSVSFADFDGDGHGDLFLYNSAGIGHVGIGNWAGGFSFQLVTYGAGYNNVSVQDLNGDGMQDIVLYSSADGRFYSGMYGLPANPTNFTFTPFPSYPGGRIIVK